MLYAPVYDVARVYAVFHRVERRADLGQHAAGDRAVGEELVDLARGQPGKQVAVLVEHSRSVGEHDQLLGLEYLGELAGHEIGIDVVGFALLAHPEGGDHRYEIMRVQTVHDLRIDALDFTHLADVDPLVGPVVGPHQHLLRPDQS